MSAALVVLVVAAVAAPLIWFAWRASRKCSFCGSHDHIERDRSLDAITKGTTGCPMIDRGAQL